MDFLSSDDKLLAPERKKWNEGFSFIAGVDEVGRGPLAGPVVAAAVAFPKNSLFPEVNDSKKLTDARRRALREEIISVPGIQYSIIEIPPDEIDKINILRASHLAMKKAVSNLSGIDFVLIDGLPVPDFPFPNEAIVKGDAKSASIAAASILAKVHRDDLMTEAALKYPGYGFEKHKGYGTGEHLEALRKFGPCPIHRKSFAPVRDIITPPPEQQEFSFD